MKNSFSEQAPLFGSLSVTILNMNGMMTKVRKGKGKNDDKSPKRKREEKVPKFVLLSQYIRAKDLDVVAIQEPHFGNNQSMEHVTKFFHTASYTLHSNLMLQGGGGGGGCAMETWLGAGGSHSIGLQNPDCDLEKC